MEYPPYRPNAAFRRRKTFRPRAERLGDRDIRRDEAYWRRQMGVQQRAFPVQHMGSRQQRARRIPYMNRQQFAETYGADADFDGWLRMRKYRPEDLEDPYVFSQVVYGRKAWFEDERYDPPYVYGHRGNRSAAGDFQRPLHREADEALQEAAEELYDMEEGRKRSRWTWEEVQQDEAERAVADLPVLTPGKKIRFEDE